MEATSLERFLGGETEILARAPFEKARFNDKTSDVVTLNLGLYKKEDNYVNLLWVRAYMFMFDSEDVRRTYFWDCWLKAMFLEKNIYCIMK